MKRLVLLAGLLVCALPVHAPGAPVNLWFEQANSFYQQELYDSAEVYYRRMVDEGVRNDAVFYNLGNACFRQQKLGQAILSYERARRLSPADPDIAHNLRFARANIIDRVPEPEQTIFERALYSFHTMLSLPVQLWGVTALLVLLSLLFALALFGEPRRRCSHGSERVCRHQDPPRRDRSSRRRHHFLHRCAQCAGRRQGAVHGPRGNHLPGCARDG